MMMKTRAALLPSCNISEVELLGQVQVSENILCGSSSVTLRVARGLVSGESGHNVNSALLCLRHCVLCVNDSCTP